MRELREDTFSGNKNDDAHEHVERVLDIVSLFNIPGVSYDAVMLRVFPITLTGAAKRWVDRLPPGTVDSWDLLKKPLSKGTVHHQKQPNSLKKSATSSTKEMRIYTKPGNGAHLDKDCPLNEEVKSIREAKYGEFGRPSPLSNGAKYSVGPLGYYTRIDNRPPF
ncbi:hypothetical protein Tco_0720326 [Tanacetum coccineum]